MSSISFSPPPSFYLPSIPFGPLDDPELRPHKEEPFVGEKEGGDACPSPPLLVVPPLFAAPRRRSMATLPVELLRLIFESCDRASVKNLRLVSGVLAEVGYEFLLPPHLTAVGWRDDISRLHCISGHGQLRNSIQSVTFNFAGIDESTARHVSFAELSIKDPDECPTRLQDVWVKYFELEEQRRGVSPFHTRADMVADALRSLPNLRELEVTYTKCPYDIDVLQEAFKQRMCRKWDRAQACKNLNVVASAIRHTRLSSLVIDRLPLEVFRMAEDRRHWFDCAHAFASLTRLDLVLDPPRNMLPMARSRAVNGLGRVLQHAPNLARLSLAFHPYHAPRDKFDLSFRAMLGPDFAFARLTDLKLEGVSCAEKDLLELLLRHAATLERLRLGGRGLARPFEPSLGGLHLSEGSFRRLLAGLRGRLPRLQRFHMEGDMQAGVFTASPELYSFEALTDDNWDPVKDPYRGTPMRSRLKMVDCRELENYLIHGGDYRVLPAAAVGPMPVAAMSEPVPEA